VIALAARHQECSGDLLPHFQVSVVVVGAYLNNFSGHFVAEYARVREGDFAVNNMQVGMTHATCCDLDQNFSAPWLRRLDRFYLHAFGRVTQYRSLHRFWNCL